MALKLVWREPHWYVSGTVLAPDGTKIRIRQSTHHGRADKKAAEGVRKHTLLRIERGEFEVGQPMTLADAVLAYTAKPGGCGPTDLSTLRRLAADLGKRQLVKLDGAELMAWVVSRGNRDSTAAREIGTINAMLAYARKLGAKVKPMTLPKPSVDDARVRWLTPEEMYRLIGHCDPKIRTLVAFLFFTGARLGASMRLVWESVWLGTTPHVVLSTRKGKGGKLRTYRVPLHGRSFDLMREWWEKSWQPPTPLRLVFPDPATGEEWDRHDFYKLFDEAKAKAGITDFTPHDCRHTFASHLIQGGVRERVVAELLGHSDLSMVMRYSHLAPDHLAEAMAALETIK